MISADAFIAAAGARGFDFYTGVPCSFLTPLINRVLSDRALRYVGAASEGEAVAIAAGAWLAGRKTVVMCQNSGLGNAVNPLTSLNAPFRIPTLFVTTWRGRPGEPDEPQHEVMGRITHPQSFVLELGIPAKPNAKSVVIRTAFWDDPEHHRSVATPATRLCGKVFGFVNRNLFRSEAEEVCHWRWKSLVRIIERARQTELFYNSLALRQPYPAEQNRQEYGLVKFR